MPRPKKDKTTVYIFPGFVTPKSNYFRLPNDWPSITAKIDNLAELKCVEYVLRHTWGYSEYGILKHISNDEFVGGRKRRDGTRIDEGTGLSLRAVRDGLNKAVEHGFLNEYVDDSDKGRIKKYYSLKMQEDLTVEEPEADGGDTISEAEILERQSLPGGGQILPSRGAKEPPRTEKDTLEGNSVENTLFSNSLEGDANLQKPSNSKFSKKHDKFETKTALDGENPQRPRRERKDGFTPIAAILTSNAPTRGRGRPKKASETASGSGSGGNHHQPLEALPKRARGRPPKAPPQIEYLITDISGEFHDGESSIRSNVSHAARLLKDSGRSEQDFAQLVGEARSITKTYDIQKKASGEAGEWGTRNKMPYFFAVLTDLLGMKDKREVGNST